MKRSLAGKCPYPPDLLSYLEDILDRATRFTGDLQAVVRIIYICKREQDLERYKDYSLIREESVRKRLKPLLVEAYRKYTPECTRGAFLEVMLYREIRSLRSGRFEISRWVLHGDVSPVCPGCSDKSIDIFESGDSFDVAVECKVSLESWLLNLDQKDDHLPCLNELRERHTRHALKVVFATFDPVQKRQRVSRLLSAFPFSPDRVLFDGDSPDW